VIESFASKFLTKKKEGDPGDPFRLYLYEV